MRSKIPYEVRPGVGQGRNLRFIGAAKRGTSRADVVAPSNDVSEAVAL